MRTCIAGAALVTPNGLLEGHHVLVVDGRIALITPREEIAEEPGTEVVDATGFVLGPGFIDIHCHGGGGRWFHEDPLPAACFHLKHGTTSLLATTILHADAREQVEALAVAADAALDPAAVNVVGINMEGPFLHPELGAYREWSRPARPQEYMEYVRASRGTLRWMTIAPEVEGVTRMVDDLQAASRGALTFSVGHSKATHDQIRALIPRGLRAATHLMNATGAAVEPARFAGTREVGVDEAVLLEDAISAEVIADSEGAHVRPDLLRLVFKMKGPERTFLVTDCTAECGGAGHDGPADLNFTASGGLAGSSLTMDRAVANFVRHTGVGLAQAWDLGSRLPARLMGFADRGEVAPGLRADLVLARWDGLSLEVEDVWIDGVSEGGRHD